jgi:hypothetical protein
VIYRDLLALEGRCSIALGLALLVAGVALGDPDPLALAAWTVGACLAVAALGRFRAPGAWFTERSLREAASSGEPLAAAPVRRRLLLETGVWVVAVVAWLVVAGSSGAAIAGTGVASALFGAVQAGPARRRVTEEEASRGATLVVVRRPGLGTPDLAEARSPGV